MTSFTKSKNSLMFFSCNEHLVPVNMQQQQPCLTFHLTHYESPGDDLHSVSLEKKPQTALLVLVNQPPTHNIKAKEQSKKANIHNTVLD